MECLRCMIIRIKDGSIDRLACVNPVTGAGRIPGVGGVLKREKAKDCFGFFLCGEARGMLTVPGDIYQDSLK